MLSLRYNLKFFKLRESVVNLYCCQIRLLENEQTFSLNCWDLESSAISERLPVTVLLPCTLQQVQLRSVFLVCGGLLSVFGSDLAGFPGAGALGCLTIAFLAGHGWKVAKASTHVSHVEWIVGVNYKDYHREVMQVVIFKLHINHVYLVHTWKTYLLLTLNNMMTVSYFGKNALWCSVFAKHQWEHGCSQGLIEQIKIFVVTV